MRPLLKLLGYAIKYPLALLYLLTYRRFLLCLKFVRTLGIYYILDGYVGLYYSQPFTDSG